MSYAYKTQADVRRAFWEMCAEFQPHMREVRGRRQNDYPADVRCRFVDFVDMETREGNMSQALAQRITL